MAESRLSNTPSVQRLPTEPCSILYSSTLCISEPSSTALLYSKSPPFLRETYSPALSRLFTPSSSVNSSTTSCFYDTYSNDSMVVYGPYDPKTSSRQLSTQTRVRRQGQSLIYEEGKKLYPHPHSAPVHLTPYQCFINKTGTPISCQLLIPTSPSEKSVVDTQPKHKFNSLESPHLPSLSNYSDHKPPQT